MLSPGAKHNTGHANLHLGDVLFFNFRDTIQECNPKAFNQVVIESYNHNVLSSHQKVTDMFTKMAVTDPGLTSQTYRYLALDSCYRYLPVTKL
ncbi:hypothetical protein DSO57_1022504 [Entomophthora muscae]|uniref:Uncharacterized protein n=1 Tax=Entomophthora muscae TaxID=34485 RepID=A0ACC2RI16_9FUNG|nr:hypothetical protein DSO57_1022504 [Entomophthora muscae]